MQREFPHNTDEQTADYLQRALDILNNAGIPAPSPDAAFAAVYASVSGKQILIEQVGSMPILPGNAGHH